jgi:hypothetical protein
VDDSLIDLLAGAALGTAVAVAVLALPYLVVRYSVITAAMFLVLWILTAAVRDAVDLSVTLSELQASAPDVRVSPLDVLAVMTALVGVGRVAARGIRTAALGLGCVLLALLAIHVARGLAETGLESSMSSAREWFYFGSALIYAATVPGGWDARVWKVLAAAGLFLAALAIPYFLIEGVAAATELIVRDGELVPSRPVGATGALLILQATILVLALRWPSRRTAAWLVLFAGGILLLLQHRTLWAAGAGVGLIAFAWWVPRQKRDVGLVSTAIVLLLLPLAVAAFVQVGPLVESASEATRSNSTLMWRTESWEQLLSEHDAPSELALGTPSGEGFTRFISGSLVTESPHNGIVEAYVRFGLPGALALVCLGLVLWSRRRDIAVGLPARAVGLLLMTQLVYVLAYALDVVQGLIIGILVSGLVAGGHRSSPLRAREPARDLAVR